MKYKPILIVPGQKNSIFFEIFFKSLKTKKFRSPLILISSIKLLKSEMKKFNFKKKIRLIDLDKIEYYKLDNRTVNLINISSAINKSKSYIRESFEIAFKIIRLKISYKLINGPINKTQFLNRKFLGMTEYISRKFNINNVAMLIYNKEISVCPITTHLPLKLIPKRINKDLISKKTELIDNFFRKNFGYRPKIAILGLNPHCESFLKFNEDTKIIKPTVKMLKKRKFKVSGPFPADTIFLKQNRKKFDVVLGMYHDQVLSPIKTLKEYDAINITLGLPFFRVSPDHGPNELMKNKNLSSPLSLIRSIEFLDKK